MAMYVVYDSVWQCMTLYEVHDKVRSVWQCVAMYVWCCMKCITLHYGFGRVCQRTPLYEVHGNACMTLYPVHGNL